MKDLKDRKFRTKEHKWPARIVNDDRKHPTHPVTAFLTRLDGVLHDLDAIGYTAQPFVIPALAAGANHNRERVFIVAYTTSNGRDESPTTRSNEAANDNSSRRTQQDSNNEERCGL